jgi:hypothetical protein
VPSHALVVRRGVYGVLQPPAVPHHPHSLSSIAVGERPVRASVQLISKWAVGSRRIAEPSSDDVRRDGCLGRRVPGFCVQRMLRGNA